MNTLSVFLRENAAKVQNMKWGASKRFLDESGEVVLWEICCITPAEDEALRESSVKQVPVPGKKGQYMKEFSYKLYLGRLAARCTVYPELNDAALQDSYGVMGADNLLKAMLTPGEYAAYIQAVQKINGFDMTFSEEVDEAKNS